MNPIEINVTNLSELTQIPTEMRFNGVIKITSLENVQIKPEKSYSVRTGLIFDLPNQCKLKVMTPKEFSSDFKIGALRSNEDGELLIHLHNNKPLENWYSSHLHMINGQTIMASSKREFEEGTLVILKGDIIAHLLIQTENQSTVSIKEIKPIDLYRELQNYKKVGRV